ncbi:hypothetical protein GCM10012286_56660 [Streptomyces lasiicapitis]|uniref:Uncharacterized protein n=2 Tax=Streptomyces lasiicapitis TaxID=1923961 RepID=A0ABQ2MIE1_9ACTN|nr:hypothetical protein GCM10012286_56660 [Streptomyces lasiicapitis]
MPSRGLPIYLGKRRFHALFTANACTANAGERTYSCSAHRTGHPDNCGNYRRRPSIHAAIIPQDSSAPPATAKEPGVRQAS